MSIRTLGQPLHHTLYLCEQTRGSTPSVRARGEEIFYYPNVSVVCGPHDLDKVFVTDPKLIVEVLSPSTERTDRGEKALNYREVSTLEEYVLIDQRRLEVTLCRRSDDWRPQVLTRPDAEAQLRSIAFTLPLGRIYDGAL